MVKLRMIPEQLDRLLHKTVDPNATVNVIAKGLPACPGAAVGQVVFTSEKSVKEAKKGNKVILVRTETSPDDIAGMHSAQGILTARGGMTSHAAIVARDKDKCGIVGCEAITVSEEKKCFIVGNITVREGDVITLNGNTGEVILGKVALVDPELPKEYDTFMEWTDEISVLEVRANADTPASAQVARDNGAKGVGLARTEHMFFGEGEDNVRIQAMRAMIMAQNPKEQSKALEELLPMQREDFCGIFRTMNGLPVTIRLLDPPLHEFLQKREDLMKEIFNLQMKIKDAGSPAEVSDIAGKIVKFEQTLEIVVALLEFNPMLGNRGCRLGITHPPIYKMQVKAIIEAACIVTKEGVEVIPEIMIPLVGEVKELIYCKKDANEIARTVMREQGITIEYQIGTMIELPRACLIADEIAQEAQFFSFGTNDLTQMTFGYSRDDTRVFLPIYIENGILPQDPYVVLDQKGVGQLVKIAVEKGRGVKPELKIGICGEHGGEPSSVEFCHRVGLNYVSCSPFRVPIARLAAAHAAIKDKQRNN